MSNQAVDAKALDRYECSACGYVYEPDKGDSKHDVEPGISFEELSEAWRCPVCGVRKSAFRNIGPKGSASGFQENLNYGLGVNRLTPMQKNILIFGGLGLGLLFFLSLYGLQ